MPTSDNAYYYANNPFYKSGYGLPNCTCYAFGRAWEVTGKYPKLSTGNAGKWYGYNKSNNFYPYGSTPKAGSIACWSGHVAFVESVNSNGTINFSESNWSGRSNPAKKFRYQTNKNPYSYTSGFQGYIYVVDGDVSKPSAPNVSVSKTQLNVGEVATLTWSSCANATYYWVSCWSSTKQEISESCSSFSRQVSFNSPGKYSITVVSGNSAGESVGNWIEINVSETYSLDVNTFVNGVEYKSGFSNVTFDVYINGSLVANDVVDYCASHTKGTTYTVNDIRTTGDYVVNGSTEFSGTVNSNVNVEPQISSPVLKKSFTYNGNKYEFYSGVTSWGNANSIAKAKGGHLATITSQGEQDAIASNNEIDFCWLGATDSESEGIWKWVTGESWSYTNWSYGEPNDYGEENYLGLYVSNEWNDFNNNDQLVEGFVVEYEHEHDLIEFGYVAPTCTQSGSTAGKKCVDCGKILVDSKEIPALGHTGGSANCVEKAVCTRCNAVYGSVNSNEHKNVVKDSAVAPTCTKTGLTEGRHCSSCGKNITVQTVIPALGHTGGSANCVEKAVCTRCNATYGSINPNEHKTVVKDSAVSPTCTETGLTEGQHCLACGKIITEQIVVPALGHIESDWISDANGARHTECTVCHTVLKTEGCKHTDTKEVTVNPTCTKSGSIMIVCNICEKKLSEEELAPIGHKIATVVSPATLSSNGKKVQKCTLCRETVASSQIGRIAKIALTKTAYAYNGKVQKPAVIVKDSAGKELKNGTDYTVTYPSGCQKPGTYTATVNFKGNYSGTQKLTYKIILNAPTSLKATRQRASYVTLTWSNVPGAVGYDVYLFNSKIKKYEKVAFVKSNAATIKKLGAGRAYRFKVISVGKDRSLNSTYSQTLNVGTNPAAPVLKAKSGTKTVGLSWRKVSGASSYTIYYSANKNGTYKKLKTVKGNSYTAKKPIAGKTYYYKVVATAKIAGRTLTSGYSNIVKG